VSDELPRAPLTPVERKLWHYLIDFLAAHSFQPSLREIARHFRIPSTRTVSDLLAALEAKGYIRRVSGRSRGVVIEGFTGGVGTQPVPLVRWESSGERVTDSMITLDRTLLATDDAFLVRASAEDAPMHAVRDGDLLLVIPGARVPEGTPVVARVGTHIIVRGIERRGTSVRLIAPSAETQDLILGDGDDFRVLGPLGAVIRLTAPRPDADDAFDPPT
jgi:repressor LexA